MAKCKKIVIVAISQHTAQPRLSFDVRLNYTVGMSVRSQHDAERARKRAKKAYWADPEKHRARAAVYNKSNPHIPHRAHLKRAYGITREHYDAMAAEQGDRCAICGIDADIQVGKKVHWCVDHSHTTDEIRGLLCIRCNAMIGNAKENPINLLSAVDYLANGSGVPQSTASALLSFGS
jgi:hypothetical protein